MNQQARKMIPFRYAVETLEDLHTGSGLGSVWVDRTLRRDGQGRPFIPATHVKGVWRDVMVRLVSLGVAGFDQDFLDNCFGAAAKHKDDTTIPQQGALSCPRLQLSDKQVESLVWMQSSRQKGSRKTADDTLRSTEYLPAGTKLSGDGYFDGSEDDFKKLSQLVRRVDRYGSNRSRGDGRVKLLCFEEIDHSELTLGSELALNPDLTLSSELAPDGIRLLLKARAPVRVPRTGSPGNIIESDTRIPGRMLAGSIISALLPQTKDKQSLFTGGIAIGDALPLNPEQSEIELSVLSKLEVVPAPFEYRVPKPKPEACNAFDRSPSWAADLAADQSTANWHDQLEMPSPSDQPGEQAQPKRLPPGTYLQRINGEPWRAYRQPLELAMRNRRGSDIEDQHGKMDNELFSNEQLPTGTCFVADIRPIADSVEWTNWLNSFLKSFKTSPVLTIGRGRAPVQIRAIVPLGSATDQARSESLAVEEFRLTLVSDAIIRTPWLGFHQRLTLNAVCDALDKSVPENTSARDVSEARIDRAFNAATRLPRPSVMALRAGSSILVTGDGANGLKKSLLEKSALGERQHEGLGRFRLDLALSHDAQRGQSEAPLSQSTPTDSDDELRTESVARFAADLAKEHHAALKKPSRSQLGNIRARLDAIKGSGGLSDDHKKVEAIRASLFDLSLRTKGGDVFQQLAQKKDDKLLDGKTIKADGALAELIQRAKDQTWTLEDIRLAWRLMLARIPRRSDSEDDGDSNQTSQANVEEQV